MRTDTQLRVDYAELGELRSAWSTYIQHGALVSKLYPPPQVDQQVELVLHLHWCGQEIALQGQVLQSSPSTTVLQLEPLDSAQRDQLVLSGLEEARAPGSAPAEASSPPAEPEPARTSEEPPRSDSSTSSPVEPPASNSSAAAPSPAASAVPSSPEPAAAQAPARPVRQQALRPIRQARSARPAAPPHPSSPEPASAPPAPQAEEQLSRGELALGQIASLSGPAGVDTESVLPAIADFGDFGDRNWRDTLISFFLAKHTGIVVIHAFRENRWCYLVEGRPVHFSVDHAHPGEFLSDALLKDGQVSAEQWKAALVAQKTTGVQAGEYLVLRKIITRAALHAALASRAAAICRNLISANFGTWSLHLMDEVRELFPWTGIDVIPLLLDAERQAMARKTDDEITKETEPHLSMHTSVVPDRAALLATLPLSEPEKILVTDLLPGGWTIKELMLYGGLREKSLLRFVWVLRAMGFIVLKPDEGEKSKRNRAERILYVALRDITRRGDFEALHCHWTAIEAEVHHGYQRILKEFGRERFEAVLDPRIEDLVSRIRTRAEEAHKSISSKEGRRQARQGLIGESQLIMAADLMLKQGEMAIYKQDFPVARACYERVLELAPKIPETSEHRQLARSQLQTPQVASASTDLPASHLAGVTAAIDKAVLD